ncbi:MAG: hypothetical protein ACYC61_31555, partial [Isosphaeraceae bacterium]
AKGFTVVTILLSRAYLAQCLSFLGFSPFLGFSIKSTVNGYQFGLGRRVFPSGAGYEGRIQRRLILYGCPA